MGPKLKCMRKKYQDVNSELWEKTQMRIMRKNSKYRDANSELWGKTQIMRGKKLKYRDANSELWGKTLNIGMPLRIMGKNSISDANSELWGKTQNENYGEKIKI